MNNDYPFKPPSIKIGNYSYSKFLYINNNFFVKNLKNFYKIDCLCCNTITCHSNWSPAIKINDIFLEIRKYRKYKKNLIIKVMLDKIKSKYLIEDIDLDTWLF